MTKFETEMLRKLKDRQMIEKKAKLNLNSFKIFESIKKYF